MPTKTYSGTTCQKCSTPHFPVLGCQLAADLQGQLNGQVSRAIGDDEATDAAYRWYDAELAKHGLKTDYLAISRRVREEMRTQKPAVHPTERLAGKNTQNTQPEPKNTQKPAKIPRKVPKVGISEKSTQKVPTENTHTCVDCGHSWKKRAKTPERCPNKACRSRKWQSG